SGSGRAAPALPMDRHHESFGAAPVPAQPNADLDQSRRPRSRLEFEPTGGATSEDEQGTTVTSRQGGMNRKRLRWGSPLGSPHPTPPATRPALAPASRYAI